MRSFLPNRPLINALKCCGNPDCGNKEAEAEAEAEAEIEIETETDTLLQLGIICSNCRVLHYCDADCQKADRENHKHQCSKDTQMLKEDKEWLERNHNKENTDNDNDDDNESFQAIFQKDDCPICALPLPIAGAESIYMECCGKSLCISCEKENYRVTLERGRELITGCPFCRATTPKSENEIVVRIRKRMEKNDSAAIFMASDYYRRGKYGLPKDPQKAFDLSLRAAKLGNLNACFNLAVLYKDGVVVTKDMTKARKYNEMAVKKGDIQARHNLGAIEWSNGNYRLASRHKLISAAAGYTISLTNIAECYQFQLVTKEEYSTALTSYIQVHKDEYSIERERAAAVPR